MFFPARQDFYSSHGSGELISKGAFTRSQSLSYAMSLPVATTISGMDSMEVLDQNLAILRGFKTLSADGMQILRDHGKQFDDGRYELYKSTIKYDRDPLCWLALRNPFGAGPLEYESSNRKLHQFSFATSSKH